MAGWGPPADEPLPLSEPPPDKDKGWGPPAEAAPVKGWGAPAPEPDSGPMPGPIDALTAGFQHSLQDIGQSVETVKGQKPTPQAADENPAAAPFEMRDLYEPYARGLPKMTYRVGESSPVVAGGVLGGLGGSAVAGPVGTAIGGAGGAAIGAALQTIGPAFAQELKKQPNDPDGAWDRAVKSTLISGAASGASWAAFPLKVLNGPIKNLAFQAFMVQPGIGVAAQAGKDVIAGDEPSLAKSWEAYKEGAIGTVVPAVGHAALRGRFGEPETKSNIPTPAESIARANDLRFEALNTTVQANQTPHQHVRNQLLQKADNLHTAADYEEDRYNAPFFANQKNQQAEALNAKAAAEPDPVLSQMYKDMATEQRRSANHDLWIAA